MTALFVLSILLLVGGVAVTLAAALAIAIAGPVRTRRGFFKAITWGTLGAVFGVCLMIIAVSAK